MKKIIATIMAILVLALCLVGCAPQASENTFVLGLDDSFPPMGYKDESGEIVGFDIDLAKEVCERLGYELVLQPINWDTKEVELNNGTIDCIWNGMSVNPERAESMSLSVPYMKNTQAVVVPASSDIYTLADLEGKIVGAQAGSTAMDAIDANPEVKESFGSLQELKDNMMCITELRNGTLEAVVADEILINYYTAEEADQWRVLDENLGEEEYAIGFRKNDTELTNKVNDTLKAMVEDGTFAEISMKWFGRDVSIIK